MTSTLKFQRGRNVATRTTYSRSAVRRIANSPVDRWVETPEGFVLTAMYGPRLEMFFVHRGRRYFRISLRRGREARYSARGVVWVAGRFAREIVLEALRKGRR